MSEPIDIPAKIAEGIALFNAGDFFEAHEAWEDAWHATAGSTKATLQVLIQLAVAMEHDKRGNPRGAHRTLQRSRRRLDALSSADSDLPDPHRLYTQVQARLEGQRYDLPHIPLA